MAAGGQQEPGAAELYFRECFEVNESLIGPNEPETLAMLRRLALVYIDEARWPEAEERCRLLCTRWEAAAGPVHVGSR